MKLTVDSNESLEDVIRVLGALFGVKLEVADDRSAPQPSSRTGRRTTDGVTPGRRSGRAAATSGKAGTDGSKVTSTRQSDSRQSRPAKAASNAEVRAWARDSGLSVKERGRIPAAVLSAYSQAQSGQRSAAK